MISYLKNEKSQVQNAPPPRSGTAVNGFLLNVVNKTISWYITMMLSDLNFYELFLFLCVIRIYCPMQRHHRPRSWGTTSAPFSRQSVVLAGNSGCINYANDECSQLIQCEAPICAVSSRAASRLSRGTTGGVHEQQSMKTSWFHAGFISAISLPLSRWSVGYLSW